MKKLKRAAIVLLLFLAAFAVYVEIVNRNSKHMTYRQKVLKAIYPAWIWWTRLWGKNSTRLVHEKKQPPVSFYSLKTLMNSGDTLDFTTLKGKKIMLVNTASDCGYTNQYEELQKLYEENKNSLLIIGFPANDFKEQEKGNDEEIAQFCKLNYGVTFPLAKKSIVIKEKDQNSVYRWLTDSMQNGWNNRQPSWNFCKYIVDEQGRLTHYFGASVSPLDEKLVEIIKK